MAGAPPQHDTSTSSRSSGADGTCPEALFEGKRLAFIKGHPKLLASPHPTTTVDPLGIEVSTLLPGFRDYAADVCVVRSMHTDQFNHAPADLLMYTGNAVNGKPSMGSWVTWGLGSINQNLPGYVVLGSGGSDPTGGKALWSSGFLPSEYRASAALGPGALRGDPVPVRAGGCWTRCRLNELDHDRHGDDETLARVAQYEPRTACRWRS